MEEAGVLQSAGGKVKLLRTRDYPDAWDPSKDNRIPVWEALHHLIRVFRREGESAAGRLLAMVKSKSESIRQLAYRLFTLAERRGEAEEANRGWPASGQSRMRGHGQAVAMILGLYPSDNESDVAHRTKLLAPILRQQDAIRDDLRARRPISDVNPDTGEPETSAPQPDTTSPSP